MRREAPEPDADADRRGHPDARGGRQAADVPLLFALQDRARPPKKADAGDQPPERRVTRVSCIEVSSAPTIKKRRAGRDQEYACASRPIFPRVALQADDRAAESDATANAHQRAGEVARRSRIPRPARQRSGSSPPPVARPRSRALSGLRTNNRIAWMPSRSFGARFAGAARGQASPARLRALHVRAGSDSATAPANTSS